MTNVIPCKKCGSVELPSGTYEGWGPTQTRTCWDCSMKEPESLTPEQEKIADLSEEVHDLKMAMKRLGELVLPIINAWDESLEDTGNLIDENGEEIRAFLDPDYCPPERE